MDKRHANVTTFLRGFMVADMMRRYCPECGSEGEYCEAHDEMGLLVAELGLRFNINRHTMSNKVSKFRAGKMPWSRVSVLNPNREYPGQEERCKRLNINRRSVQRWMHPPHNMTEDEAVDMVLENKARLRDQHRGKRSDPPDVCALASSFNSLPVLDSAP